jgi:hypothetical protein
MQQTAELQCTVQRLEAVQLARPDELAGQEA